MNIFSNARLLPSQAYRLLAGTILAGAGGWLAFCSSWETLFPGRDLEPHFFMVGLGLLLCGWMMGVRQRWSAWLCLFFWYASAGAAIPQVWDVYFGGSSWGWLVWLLFASLLACPILLVPVRFISGGLAIAALIGAMTPIGMLTPLHTAIAFFPGWGWWGLVSAWALLWLPMLGKYQPRLAGLLCVAVFMTGATLNSSNPDLPTPTGAMAMNTFEGNYPKQAEPWMARQKRMANQARMAIESGHSLVITPETTVEIWDIWAILMWKETIEAAKARNSLLLIGIQHKQPDGWRNGLFDAANQGFYGATMSIPFGMWRPWSPDLHFPVDFAELGRLVKTPHGLAAYLICWEEMLLWPLLMKVAQQPPAILISSSNQWFTHAWAARAQWRSVRFQSRLWGLPLLRSVNWASQQ